MAATHTDAVPSAAIAGGPRRRLSVRDMRSDLDAAQVDHSGCIERGELESLHAAHCKPLGGVGYRSPEPLDYHHGTDL